MWRSRDAGATPATTVARPTRRRLARVSPDKNNKTNNNKNDNNRKNPRFHLPTQRPRLSLASPVVRGLLTCQGRRVDLLRIVGILAIALELVPLHGTALKSSPSKLTVSGLVGSSALRWSASPFGSKSVLRSRARSSASHGGSGCMHERDLVLGLKSFPMAYFNSSIF